MAITLLSKILVKKYGQKTCCGVFLFFVVKASEVRKNETDD
jgi:hypothetical protein